MLDPLQVLELHDVNASSRSPPMPSRPFRPERPELPAKRPGSARSSRPVPRQLRGETAACAPLETRPRGHASSPRPPPGDGRRPARGSTCQERRLTGIGAVAVVPEDLREHPQGGDAVCHAVMDPDHERRSAIVERAGEVDAPERSRVVQALGHHLAGEGDQLLPVVDGLRRSRTWWRMSKLVSSSHAGVARFSGVDADAAELGGGPRRERPGGVPGPASGDRRPRADRGHHLQGVAGDHVGLEPEDAGVVGAEPLHHAFIADRWRRGAAASLGRGRLLSSPASFAPCRMPGVGADGLDEGPRSGLEADRLHLGGSSPELSSAGSLFPA